MPFNIFVPDLLLTLKCNFKCKYCFENKSNKDLDFDIFKKYAESNCYLGFFTFGGEPLMRVDILKAIIDNTRKDRREAIKHIITNGSLIEKHLDFIKNYGISVQISIDGPEHVNDLNRVFANGDGTYDIIMKNIEVCIKNKIRWSLHGVVNQATLPYLCEIYKWFYEMVKLYEKPEKVLERMGGNIFQVIFEENWTDKDIDIYLRELEKICEWINNLKELNQNEKSKFAMSIFNHKGGVCGAGYGLFALDTDLDIYPCHRLATQDNRKDYSLGNVYELNQFKNFKYYNSYVRIKKYMKMYSAIRNNYGYKKPELYRHMNWCPATNYQVSGTVYYQNAKYNVMITEVNRKIEELIKRYGYHTEQGHRSGHKCDS